MENIKTERRRSEKRCYCSIVTQIQLDQSTVDTLTILSDAYGMNEMEALDLVLTGNLPGRFILNLLVGRCGRVVEENFTPILAMLITFNEILKVFTDLHLSMMNFNGK